MATDWNKTISNSNSRCLLENWVEERKSRNLDKNWKYTGPFAHLGLLTVYKEPMAVGGTCYSEDYKLKMKPLEEIGSKTRDRSDEIHEIVKKQIELEKQALAVKIDYRSQTTVDFSQHKLPPKPQLERKFMCELATEQPATFWTDQYDRQHGITQRSASVKPFRRCSNFSTPLEWQLDAPQPYEMNGYTSMSNP